MTEITTCSASLTRSRPEITSRSSQSAETARARYCLWSYAEQAILRKVARSRGRGAAGSVGASVQEDHPQNRRRPQHHPGRHARRWRHYFADFGGTKDRDELDQY